MSAQRNPSLFRFFTQFREMRRLEEQQAKSNQFLAQALEREKKEGHRLAVIVRTVALGMVCILLPFLNPRLNVLYYEVAIVMFIGLGWLQLKLSSVGYSKAELLLIFVDLGLLTLLFAVPNPFLGEEIPTAMTYRFDSFIYFFIILAVGTLAYSWRTVWAMGTWVALLWMIGFLSVSWFGHEIPELSEAAAIAFENHSIVSVQPETN